jgi:membrane protease subunit HflK
MDQLKMAWNEPGSNKPSDNDELNNDKKKSIGGNRRNQDGPPDLEEIFSNLRKKIISFLGFKTFKSGNIGNNRFNYFKNGNNVFIAILVGIVAVVYSLAGFYIVNPAEQAVITRFGKFNRVTGPGPHWLPRFIEVNTVVNSEQVGFSKHSASMLTKDENIIFVEIELQYRILDVNHYLFKVSEPIKTLKQAAESALRQVVGHSNLDFIMTEGRTQISEDIKQQVSAILDQYKAGIQVITVAFKEAKAPEAVKSSFDDVIKAREEQERLKHAAEAFANKMVPEAEGDAQRMLVEAEGYRREVIARATGDTLRFNAVLFEYNKAPEITKKRLYIDAVEEILSNTSKIIVDLKQSNNLIYLPLDKLMGDKLSMGRGDDNKTSISSDIREEANEN